jgi:hypothetical protein
MQEKEKWIEDTISSLQGMQPAAANPFLHTRILAKLQDKLADKVPLKWALASVAGFIFLLWFNVRVLTNSNRNASYQNNNGIEQVMQDYGLSSNNNIYTNNISK